MKNLLLLLLVNIMMIDGGCTNSRKSRTELFDTTSAVQADINSTVKPDTLTEEEIVVQMLTEFYTVYSETWGKFRGSALVEQLDALLQKYCTQKFSQKEAFGVQGLDHDIFTADYGIDNEAIKTLLVIKDNVRENTYCVSYTMRLESPNPSIKEKDIYYVQIQLVVVKEDGDFKIDDVLNPYSGIWN